MQSATKECSYIGTMYAGGHDLGLKKDICYREELKLQAAKIRRNTLPVQTYIDCVHEYMMHSFRKSTFDVVMTLLFCQHCENS